MRPIGLSGRVFLVSIERNGQSVGEFDVALDDSGRWTPGRLSERPAQLRDIEDATAMLVATLGPGTKVRTAIFLPSGLIFAVGNNGGREAAVYLIFVTSGPRGWALRRWRARGRHAVDAGRAGGAIDTLS